MGEKGGDVAEASDSADGGVVCTSAGVPAREMGDALEGVVGKTTEGKGAGEGDGDLSNSYLSSSSSSPSASAVFSPFSISATSCVFFSPLIPPFVGLFDASSSSLTLSGCVVAAEDDVDDDPRRPLLGDDRILGVTGVCCPFFVRKAAGVGCETGNSAMTDLISLRGVCSLVFDF